MRQPPRESAERRFEHVFAHLPALVAYARRRGSGDPEGLAAETMATAWAKLADLPPDDPRPRLFATARNLLRSERRRRAARPERPLDPEHDDPGTPDPEPAGLDPAIARALAALSPDDRELLLLIAWEELRPAAAAALGISAATCRVRLHRARRRFAAALAEEEGAPAPATPLEAR